MSARKPKSKNPVVVRREDLAVWREMIEDVEQKLEKASMTLRALDSQINSYE